MPARRSARIVALAAITLSTAGCICVDPWVAFPDRTAPDEQLSNTAGTHGFDMYIWHCERSQRVVVAQYSAEYSCASPRRETTTCGGVTSLEQEVRREPVGPIRSGREWR